MNPGWKNRVKSVQHATEPVTISVLFSGSYKIKGEREKSGSVNLTIKSIASDTLFLVLILTKRNRTSAKDIGYGLYLYFLGLSYRNTAKALCRFVKRSHVAVWKWIQKYKPERISYRRRKVSELVIDETQIKVGNDYFWLWIAIELNNKSILDIYLSAERNMFVAQNFIRNLVNKYGKHTVSTDGGTWYPYACKFLKLRHHLHSSFEKSIIERTIQYIKDRIENFDDYFPCRKKRCKLNHVTSWFNVFVDSYNTSMAP